MYRRNRNVSSNVFDYALSPDSPEESTVLTVATDIASIEPLNLLSAGCQQCQDHRATETNSSRDISFADKREKALEFIRCQVAENRGKPQWSLCRTAERFGIPTTTFLTWTNEAIKKWEQEHCCQPMGAAAWCISASSKLSSYVGAILRQTPKPAMPHEEVRPPALRAGTQKPQAVPELELHGPRFEAPHMC